MLRIGIDDTDSEKGGCTTYIAALLADDLSKFSKVKRVRLVRLNPNIPWKTRGNGSVCLEVDTGDIARAKALALEIVKSNSIFGDSNTNPGVAFYEDELNEDFHRFYFRALRGIVEMEDARSLAVEYGVELHGFKNSRGVIGALAAVGSTFKDATYELIAYRTKENWGKARKVDVASVLEMDKATVPLTFNNYDWENRRVLITPHSPCPVLLGIRGEEPSVLTKAYAMVKVDEPVERTQIFYTNQGTDAHLVEVDSIADVDPYSSVILEGHVASAPKTIAGGHVICTLEDGDGSIDFAAYEPTKSFRSIVKRLLPGDRVRIYGGAKYSSGMGSKLTINLEKLEVIQLAKAIELVNPTCDECGRRMESAGVGQGFRCRRCKTYKREKEEREIERGLVHGLYSVPPCAMRHLSKPLCRMR
jgi:tRNA(Ile2)-agmatinylcytidine synthase